MFTVPEEVTAISLDIWKTLLYGNKDFTRPRLRLIFDLLGHEHLDTELIVEKYRTANVYFDEKSEATGEDYGMADRLGVMYKLLRIEAEVPDPETISAIQAETGKLRCTENYLPTLVESDLLDTLEKLRNQGYVLGLLSNTGMDNGQAMEPTLRFLGIWQFVRTAVFSSDDGRAKPNPDLFLRMADELGAEPQQVLHIGDNIKADYPAHKAGLHTALYAPKSSHLPHVKTLKELIETSL